MSDVTISSNVPVPAPPAGTSSPYMGVLGALGGAGVSSALSLFESGMNRKFNREEAQKNRDWQERMSGTAHQREVADLLKAGLNPILSAGGAGSAVTGGSTASAPTSTPAAQAAIAGLGAMSQTALNVSQARLANSAAALNDMNVRKTELDNLFQSSSFDTRLEQAFESLDLTKEQKNELKARIKLHGAMSTDFEGRAKSSSAHGSMDEISADFYKNIGQGGPFIKFLGEVMKMIKDAGPY